MQKYYKKHQENYQELMEIYLEFLHKNLTCRRCKKQDPVVHIAGNPKRTKELSPTQTCMGLGFSGDSGAVGLIQMDQP